eukprot:UN23698
MATFDYNNCLDFTLVICFRLAHIQAYHQLLLDNRLLDVLHSLTNRNTVQTLQLFLGIVILLGTNPKVNYQLLKYETTLKGFISSLTHPKLKRLNQTCQNMLETMKKKKKTDGQDIELTSTNKKTPRTILPPHFQDDYPAENETQHDGAGEVIIAAPQQQTTRVRSYSPKTNSRHKKFKSAGGFEDSVSLPAKPPGKTKLFRLRSQTKQEGSSGSSGRLDELAQTQKKPLQPEMRPEAKSFVEGDSINGIPQDISHRLSTVEKKASTDPLEPIASGETDQEDLKLGPTLSTETDNSIKKALPTALSTVNTGDEAFDNNFDDLGIDLINLTDHIEDDLGFDNDTLNIMFSGFQI